MNRIQRSSHICGPRANPVFDDVAVAYNQAQSAYGIYADGDSRDLFAFNGQHACADRCVWSTLDAKLRDRRATGATSISILDAGCGPGTWLQRLVVRAGSLGFTQITARGFDVAAAQIDVARQNTQHLRHTRGIDLAFEVADLEDRLPEAESSVDLTLCLYSVLSHLPADKLPGVAAEIGRVTRGHFVTTVRSVGSMPTIFIDTIEAARRLEFDHDLDRCEIEFNDGRHMVLRFHLFAPGELKCCFANHFEIEDLRGLDIFRSRFNLDHRWNPDAHAFDPRFEVFITQLEERFAHNPSFMERATHLMLVGRRGTSG
jgi:SAM-dependent methyltransferase